MPQVLAYLRSDKPTGRQVHGKADLKRIEERMRARVAAARAEERERADA